jgi:hypothetical protein
MYVEAAFIKNGTITNAKIGSAAIDDAKIANLSAAKITARSIAVGQYIQGTGYVAGSAGWRINGDGTAEFSDVVVRGTVYASSGVFSGTVYASAGTFTGTVSASTINGGTINSTTLNSSTINGTTINSSTINSVTLNSGVLNITGDGGSGWGYARSNAKWWADGSNGWIMAREPGGSSFTDIQGGSNRIWMSNWGDCGITFPGFTVTNGGLTISQANVINTLNIAGNAVTTMNSGSGGGACSTTLYVPAYQTMRVVGIGFFAQFTPSNVTEGSYYPVLTINGTSISGFVMRIGSYATLPGSSSSILVNYVDVYGGESGLTCTLSISGTYNNTGTNKIIGFGTLR